MNRVRAVALVLVVASLGLGNLPADAFDMQDDKPVGQKTIKDQAEYNAYMAALNETDPVKKASMMEAFVQQYPQSIVKIDALEQAMAAYQQSLNAQPQNAAKVEDTAKRILQLTPDHIRALAIVVAFDRNKATQGDQAALKESCTYAQTGSQQLPKWQKPDGMNDADFDKLRNQMADIFSGAAGFCALQAKNYSAARDAFTKAVQIDSTNLQDMYQLAVADLEMNPIDVNGLWYCAKAINLAQRMNNADAVKGMVAYCKAKYKRYHGGDDGWDQTVAGAATQNVLPSGFAVKPAPTPAELAVQAVQQNPPDALSFGDKEFVLQFRDVSPANKEAADKVWASIQAMQKNGEARLKIPQVKVISSTTESVDAAVTEDNQTASKADLHVVMEKPMLHPLAVNSSTDIIGVLTTYTPQPFMFTMEHGELPVVKKPAAKKPASKGKSAASRKKKSA